MIRFTMPEAELPQEERKALLQKQFDAFLQADALEELLSALGTDRSRLAEMYGRRQKPCGGVMEMQDMPKMPELSEHREQLFPLFQELGFVDIDVPCRGDHNRLLIYGGALAACFDRTCYSTRFLTERTESVEALTCYRPINPAERGKCRFDSMAETEAGALTEAITEVYGLTEGAWEDVFSGDRNLNSISCCRTYRGGKDGRAFRVFIAPSTDPHLRRADTGDCIVYYEQLTNPKEGDSLLAVTNRRFCNRQFIQTAYRMIRSGCQANFDIVGCHPSRRVATAKAYDPLQYLQDLIVILDWIEKFRQL